MSLNTGKLDETRYTIRFNPADPRHRIAMEILSRAGRRKSTLIADAICAYYSGAAFQGGVGVAQAAELTTDWLHQTTFWTSYAQPQLDASSSFRISSDWVGVIVGDNHGAYSADLGNLNTTFDSDSTCESGDALC